VTSTFTKEIQPCLKTKAPEKKRSELGGEIVLRKGVKEKKHNWEETSGIYRVDTKKNRRVELKKGPANCGRDVLPYPWGWFGRESQFDTNGTCFKGEGGRVIQN